MTKYHILEFASFAGIGGTQTMLVEFLRYASHEKYHFYLCVLLEHGVLNEEVEKLGIEHTSLNMKGYRDLSVWWKLYQFVKDKQIDLMRTYGLKAHIIGRIVGKLAGIPVNITSVRNTDPWRKWYHVLLDSATSGLTDLYLSNSEAGRLATHQREHIPLSKILTIPNGINLADYAPYLARKQEISAAYRQEFGIAPDAPLLGSIANLREQKGHKTIIDALPFIRERFPDIVCIFVGDDLVHGAIHRYVREQRFESKVILTGFRQDIPALLTMFNIFVLPSRWEGIPRAILEAMAMKVPVITTAVGGIPEVVEAEKTGMFVSPEDPQALAEAVIALLTDPERAANMGEAGYERIRNDFSLIRVVTQTEQVYERLIKEKRR